MSLTIDKFASQTGRLSLPNPVDMVSQFHPEPGTVVAVRALSENPNYPHLELPDGSLSRVRSGEALVGVLGSRQALRGFVGYAPYRVTVGETLHLLNIGGVVGRLIDSHPKLGEPVRVRLLGAVAREGKVVHLRDVALPPARLTATFKPIVLVVGSCMNVGKTVAATALVRELSAGGLRVGAAKVTGVACMRDTRAMEAAGAVKTATFVDCGLPSTVDADDLAAVARTLAAHLSPVSDVIVMELGDGIIGHYNVDAVFKDRRFMGHVSAVVYSAADLVSAWGGIELLSRRGVTVAVVTGPATDTEAGTKYISCSLEHPAANAQSHAEALGDIVLSRLPSVVT
jgi:hypothetical protein